TLEIEASTLPDPIRLDRQCKRYAYRVLQMLPDDPVRQRTPSSFPSTLQTEITPSPSTSSSESESSSTSRPRPARINYAFHPQQGTLLPLQLQRKKKPHQIFRRAPTSLVNNHFSPPRPLTSPTFTDKSALFICFPSTFIN